MKCINCSSIIPKEYVSGNYCFCPHCSMLHLVCESDNQPHLHPPMSIYCPICGVKITQEIDPAGAYFSHNPTKGYKYSFPDPIMLPMKGGGKIFSAVFDLFLILISDNGQGVVYQGQEQVKCFDLRNDLQEKIVHVERAIDSLLFVTSKGGIHKVLYSCLFSSSISLTKLVGRSTCYSFDSKTNTLVYAINNELHLINLASDQEESIKLDGRISQLTYRSGFLFFIRESKDNFTFVSRSLDLKLESDRTMPYINHRSKILITASDKYLGVSCVNNNQAEIWGGAWRQICRNRNSWESTSIDGQANKLSIKGDSLYIQLLGKILEKSFLNLGSGVTSIQRSVLDIIPASMMVSMQNGQVSFLQLDCRLPGTQKTIVKLLGEGLTTELYESQGIDLPVSNYLWYNGRLVIIAKEQNEFYFFMESREKKMESREKKDDKE